MAIIKHIVQKDSSNQEYGVCAVVTDGAVETTYAADEGRVWYNETSEDLKFRQSATTRTLGKDIYQDLIPDTDNTYDIGTDAAAIRNIFTRILTLTAIPTTVDLTLPVLFYSDAAAPPDGLLTAKAGSICIYNAGTGLTGAIQFWANLDSGTTWEQIKT